MQTQLTPADQAAIQRLVKGSDAAIALRHHSDASHTHKGTIAIIADYEMTVNKDEAYTPTTSTPLKAVLALLCESNPEMTGKIQEALNDALYLQMRSDKGEEGAKERLAKLCKDAPSAMKATDEMLSTLPKKTRAGKIHSFTCEVTSLDAEIVKSLAIDHMAKQAQKAASDAEAIASKFG